MSTSVDTSRLQELREKWRHHFIMRDLTAHVSYRDGRSADIPHIVLFEAPFSEYLQEQKYLDTQGIDEKQLVMMRYWRTGSGCYEYECQQCGRVVQIGVITEKRHQELIKVQKRAGLPCPHCNEDLA